jgi:1,4-alpha-glucan branching enzyme
MPTTTPPTPSATRRNAACRRADDCDRCDACRAAPALVRLGRPVRFQLQFAATSVSLFLCAPEGGSTTTPMNRQPNGSWELTLRLTPGTYRFRYHVERAGATAHPPPADAAGEPIGPDRPYAVLDVGPDWSDSSADRDGPAGVV